MFQRYTLSVLSLLGVMLFTAGSVSAELRTLPSPENASLSSVVLIGDSTVRNGTAPEAMANGAGANRCLISLTYPKSTSSTVQSVD